MVLTAWDASRPWVLATNWPRNLKMSRWRSFTCRTRARKKRCFAALSEDGETRTRTGDTTIFRHLERCWSYLAICSADVAPRGGASNGRDTRRYAWFRWGFGHEDAVRGQSPGPRRRQAEAGLRPAA